MNNSMHVPKAENGSHTQSGKIFSIADIIDNVFFYRGHFLFVFIFITAIVIIYSIIATPIYSADLLIQVEEKKGSSLGALTQVANALGTQQSPVLGEIEILRSRNVVGRAVDNLKANVEVRIDNRLPILGSWLERILPLDSDGLTKPLWGSSNIAWGGERLKFDELVVPDYLLGQPLYLEVFPADAWELRDKAGNILALGAGIEKNVFGLNGKLHIAIEALRARPKARFKIVVYSIQSRIQQILPVFSVNEARRQSSILRLTYENASAHFAAALLNEIGDVYLKQNISRRSEEAELSLKFLTTELPKLRVQLDASEKALNEFRSRTKTIDISSEIRELIVKATAIEKTQLELELKKREFSERYDPLHPLMKALASQLSGVAAEHAQLTKKIGQLPTIEQDYIRLARDAQVNNQLYVSLLNNAQQLEIAKAGTTGNVAIVDRAVVPELPSRPKKALIAALGSLAGLILGFAYCQVLGLLGGVLRDPRKLEQATSLPILAIIPVDEDQRDRGARNDDTPFMLAKEKPNSSNVEALRSLRTALLFKLSEKSGMKTVLITSAVSSQGKSFISANLSYLLAATGKRVLFIEADIRLASSKRYILQQDAGWGLSTVLNSRIPVEGVIIRDVFPNLDFLPAGPHVKNPGDLLATDLMSEIIESLAPKYDLLIIDSPPLLPVHDARFLGKLADLTLFVARQDHVNLPEIHDALDLFAKAGNEINGLIFNGFVPTNFRYGYGYGYAYGYRYGLRRKVSSANRYQGYGSYKSDD